MYSLGGVHEFVTEPAPNDWLKRLNPQWMVTVGSAEHGDATAKMQGRVQTLLQLLPNTCIGMRVWDDDKIATRLIRRFNGSVEAAADYYAQTYFPLYVRGSWLMVGNEEEASKTDPGVFASVVAFHTAVAIRANAAGIPCGLCCTAMGEPEYGQYELLVPLFKAMQDGRARGVYHIWRPNTYFPHSQGMGEAERVSMRFHLSHRHQREGRRVAREAGLQFPPTAFGEFNTVVSLANNLDGPNSIPDYSATEWMDDLLWSEVDLPYAVYCYGDGLYDAKWMSFDLRQRSDYMEAMVQRLPRRAGTLLEEWRKTVTNPTAPVIPPPTSGGVKGVVASFPQGVAYRNIRSQPVTSLTNDIGDLKPNELIIAYTAALTADNWCYIERHASEGSPDGVKGWVLWTGVVFAPELLPPDPPAETTYSLTAAQRTVLLDYLTRSIDDLTAAKTLVEGLAPSNSGGL